MHDPMTVAFEIKYPWAKSRRTLKNGSEHVYRESCITIWHVDPERDGSDDSCGWFAPKLTKKQRERLRNVAWSEARNPYFLRYDEKEMPSYVARVELEALYRGLVLMVADTLDIPCTFEQAAREAATSIHRPDATDRGGVFCYRHGYHDNFPETAPDSEWGRRLREDHFVGIMAGVARNLLRERRPWYRHPRWHIWHWKIQVRPLQKLRRWLFERCGECGKRFGWDEAPTTYSWGGGGPCFHHGCTTAYEQRRAAEVLIDEVNKSVANGGR